MCCELYNQCVTAPRMQFYSQVIEWVFIWNGFVSKEHCWHRGHENAKDARERPPHSPRVTVRRAVGEKQLLNLTWLCQFLSIWQNLDSKLLSISRVISPCYIFFSSCSPTQIYANEVCLVSARWSDFVYIKWHNEYPPSKYSRPPALPMNLYHHPPSHRIYLPVMFTWG